jgi:hypothetical protein
MHKISWAALAGAVVCGVGCTAGDGGGGAAATIGKVRQEVRGADPATVRAPAYVISVDSIKIDRAASMPREIYSDVMFHHYYARADKVRVGLDAQLQTSDGHTVTYPVPGFDCQIGSDIDGGRLGPLQYTREGSTYTRCLANPFRPTLAGAPIQLQAVAVHDDETLNLFTALSVLDPGDAWLSGTGTDISPRMLLSDIGSTVGAVGSIVSLFPPAEAVGTVISAVGAVFTLSSYFVNPVPDPIVKCSVSPSLVPGFGTGATPTDAVSPVLRTSLTGRELYEATAQGDALVAYDLDFGAMPYSIMCNRPRTEIVFRIRRIPMEGDPAGWMRARSSTIVAPEPNQIDAFAVGSSATTLHDARGYDPTAPLAFESDTGLSGLRWVVPNPYALPNPCATDSSPTLSTTTTSTTATTTAGGGKDGGCWLPIFGARTNVAALTRSPNQIDLYAIDRDGDLEWTTRDLHSSPSWNGWRKVSSGGLFPPGAPISAVSRTNRVADVVAIARDGSMQRFFQFDSYFSAPLALTARDTVAPYDGTRRGGVVIVAFPWGDGTYAIGWDGTLVSAWGDPLSSAWSYAEHFAAGDFHAPPGARMAGVSRESNRLDVFVVDEGGLMRTTRWTRETGWATFAEVMTSSSMAAPPGAPLAVVSRKVDVATAAFDPVSEETNNEEMDVFVVGSDGHLIDAHWRFGDNGYRWSPADARVLSATAAPGGAIGAVAPYAGAIFVAAARSDGTLTKTWFEDLELGGGLHWQTTP